MTAAPARPAVRRQVLPVSAAGFVTAFGAHAVAANPGRYALGHHGSLWKPGLLLGIYDGAEVVLKPVFGALTDRTGAKPVMIGGLVLFAAASAAFVIGGNPHLLGPIAGGAIVVAGDYPALFAALAIIAILTAAAIAGLVPHAQPAPKPSAATPGLGRQLSSAAFLQPVLLLAAATPAGFARLAAITPPGQLGRTMGAAEGGRELGDAGGPVLVGAFSLIGLTAGLGALSAALIVCAGLAAPRNRANHPIPGRHHRNTGPPHPFSQAEGRLGPDDHPTH